MACRLFELKKSRLNKCVCHFLECGGAPWAFFDRKVQCCTRQLEQYAESITCFWIPELNVKYIQGDMSGLMDPNSAESGFRYYEELVHKFESPLRVGAYILSFVLLSLHLLHGFSSAFQSVGANNKYTKSLKGFSKVYAIGVPLGFIFIALFHHLNH